MSDTIKTVRYGYKNIVWKKIGNSEWISACSKYQIIKADNYFNKGFVATKKILVDAKPSYLVYDDHIETDTITKAKKWCNDNCLREYLHWLQIAINETNRYGQ